MRYTEPYTIFKRTLKSGKSVYYYRYRMPDNTLSSGLSTGCTDLASAKRYCQKLYNSGAFAVYQSISFFDYTRHFFDLDSKYVKWRKSNGHPLEENTRESYINKLNYQLLPFFYKYEIPKITKDVIKQWVIWASDKWSPKTLNNAQGVLGIIMTQATDEQLIIANPVIGIEYRPRIKRDRKLLTVEEIRQIYNSEWHNEKQRLGFLIACLTGMRQGEICSLAVSDLNVEQKYLYVHTSNKKHGVGSTKTDQNRIVPIPAKLIKLFDLSKDWIVDYNNQPMPIHNLYNSFIRKCESLGINTKERGITFHSLRNFFTSYLAKKSVIQYKIDAITGHSNKTMTDWYTYWNADMFEEVYKAQEELIGEILCH